VTDAALLAELIHASPSFGLLWRGTAEAYSASAPPTLSDALFDLFGHLLGLAGKDRHRELGPLLATIERIYAAGTETQRGLLRTCVLETLATSCPTMGLDPSVFLVHLGPQCRAVWSDVAGG
jgi:hypothetical protein